MDAGEAPDECSMLMLRRVGEKVALVHKQTGEWCMLESGMWTLMRDAASNGILVPEPGASGSDGPRKALWARHVLQWRLVHHRTADRADVAIMKDQALIGWQAGLLKTGRERLAFEAVRGPSDRPFACEVFLCHFPPAGTQTHVWWNINYMTQALLGLPKYDSWVSRKAERFEKVVSEAGLDPETCLRRSHRSLAGRQRARERAGAPSPVKSEDSAEDSFVVSTEAMLAIAASIAARPRQWRAQQPKQATETALWIIDSICASIDKVKMPKVTLNEQPLLYMSMDCDSGALPKRTGVHCESARLQTWASAHMLPALPATFGQVSLAIGASLPQQCRLSPQKRSVLQAGFLELAGWLQACADSSRPSSRWRSGSYLRLPEMLGPKGCRRRLPFSLKAAVSAEVSNSPALRCNAQVVVGLEAARLSGAKDAKLKKQSRNRSKNSNKFSRGVMVGYLHACRERNAHHKHANLQLDGSTLSGMDLEFFAFWNPTVNEGCWLPPMEPASTPLCLETPLSRPEIASAGSVGAGCRRMLALAPWRWAALDSVEKGPRSTGLRLSSNGPSCKTYDTKLVR